MGLSRINANAQESHENAGKEAFVHSCPFVLIRGQTFFSASPCPGSPESPVLAFWGGCLVVDFVNCNTTKDLQ